MGVGKWTRGWDGVRMITAGERGERADAVGVYAGGVGGGMMSHHIKCACFVIDKGAEAHPPPPRPHHVRALHGR